LFKKTLLTPYIVLDDAQKMTMLMFSKTALFMHGIAPVDAQNGKQSTVNKSLDGSMYPS
jgi:hypothetical protein